jgi:hypothetical protein
MPNAIKYSTSAQTLALKKGNYWIGTGDVGKGPTSTTDYYNGITPPAGGYTIYLNKASGGPSIYTAANDSTLISLSNTIAGQTFATVAAALDWFATQTDKMVFDMDYPAIVTNGLVLNLDAGFTPSYPTSGTSWYDLSSNGYNGTLINGPTFSSANGGSIVIDGVDDSCYVGQYPNLALNQLTLSVWCYPTNAQNGSGPGRMIASMNDVNGWQNGYGIFTYPYQNKGPQVNFFINSGSGQDYIQLLISNNQWYNFTMTFDGTTQVGYSNGSLIESKSRTLVYDSRNRFTIGEGYQYNAPYSGNIASVFLYNRALSSAEVSQNYNATKSRFGL